MIEASRDRVWRLIGKVIFSSLPNMENVEILDESSFRALLRMKVLGLGLNMKLKGEMVDMVPPGIFWRAAGAGGPRRVPSDESKGEFCHDSCGERENIGNL